MPKSIALNNAKQINHKLLLVEDNHHVLKVIHEILEAEGYHVATATSGEAAIEALYTNDFDLVITDLNMGQVNGISVLKKAKELNPETMVIITTGNTDVRFVIEALRYNANDYILKPFNLNDFLDRVSHYFEELSPLGLNYTTHTEIT